MTKRPRKGQMGWSHHARGGVVIDIVGKLDRMPAPYGTQRYLGPFSFPKGAVHHLDDLPKAAGISSISSEVMERIGLTTEPSTTAEVVEAWKKAKAQ